MTAGAGWPMGPCTLVDLVGIDVHVHASEALYEKLREPRMAPPARIVAMKNAGLLGRKSRPRLLRVRLTTQSAAPTKIRSSAGDVLGLAIDVHAVSRHQNDAAGDRVRALVADEHADPRAFAER